MYVCLYYLLYCTFFAVYKVYFLIQNIPKIVGLAVLEVLITFKIILMEKLDFTIYKRITETN